MSEKPKFNKWDAYNPDNDEEYIASVLEDLNKINRKIGRPEVKLVGKEEARTGLPPEEIVEEPVEEQLSEDLDRDREMELAADRARELDLDRERELEQARGFDVRKIMAEEAAAKELSRSRINDPDMHEIIMEDIPKREINIIGGQIKSNATKERERVESEEDEIAALQEKLAAIDEELADLENPVTMPENPNPLRAVGVDWSESEEKLAENLAKKDLKKELKEFSQQKFKEKELKVKERLLLIIIQKTILTEFMIY